MQIVVCTVKKQVFDQAFVAVEGKNNRFVLCKIGVERFIRKAALKKNPGMTWKRAGNDAAHWLGMPATEFGKKNETSTVPEHGTVPLLSFRPFPVPRQKRCRRSPEMPHSRLRQL